jgi:hypothetical protein
MGYDEMPIPLSAVSACLGLAFASGLNCYAVLILIALSQRFGGDVSLPGQIELLARPVILWPAAALYVVEFGVDQRRRLGTVWDAMHAFVRPCVGAGLAFLALGPMPLIPRLAGAAVGGGLAFAAHGTKASIRFAARARGQARVTIFLSLTEDLAAALLTFLALLHPVPALAMVAAGGVTTALILPRVLVAFARATSRTLDSVISRAKARQ